MAMISPSILSADFMNMERDVLEIQKNGADYVHVDVMDGIFVPNITIGIPVTAALRNVTSLPLDVHLMIDRPLRYVEHFCKAGADILTIHLEADTAENTRLALEKIRALGVKAGLSLKPGTPMEAALPFLPLCDLILIMTVEPGFGGQKFMADQMDKLHFLHDKLLEVNPQGILEVDGGVDLNTAPLCKANGASLLVTGSAYFKANHKASFVQKIQA